jgi:hypothetical protein
MTTHNNTGPLCGYSRLYQCLAALWGEPVCPLCSCDYSRCNDVTPNAKWPHLDRDALAQRIDTGLGSRCSRLPWDTGVVQRSTNVGVNAMGTFELCQGGLDGVVRALQVNLLDSRKSVRRDAFDGCEEIAGRATDDKVDPPKGVQCLCRRKDSQSGACVSEVCASPRPPFSGQPLDPPS